MKVNLRAWIVGSAVTLVVTASAALFGPLVLGVGHTYPVMVYAITAIVIVGLLVTAFVAVILPNLASCKLICSYCGYKFSPEEGRRVYDYCRDIPYRICPGCGQSCIEV